MSGKGYRVTMFEKLLSNESIKELMGCDECWTENERLYLISGTEFTLCRGCMLNLIENDGPMCITALNGPIEAVKEEWGVDDHKVSTPYGCTLCIYLTPLSPKWGNWERGRELLPASLFLFVYLRGLNCD